MIDGVCAIGIFRVRRLIRLVVVYINNIARYGLNESLGIVGIAYFLTVRVGNEGYPVCPVSRTDPGLTLGTFKECIREEIETITVDFREHHEFLFIFFS